MSNLAGICGRIERDFGEPRLLFPGIAIHPLRDWPGEPVEDVGDLVAVSGGHRFRINGGLGDEEITAFVADRLQDDAINRLGAPWPVLVLPDGTEAVMEPRLSPEGIAVWAARVGDTCPIGRLYEVTGLFAMIG